MGLRHGLPQVLASQMGPSSKGPCHKELHSQNIYTPSPGVTAWLPSDVRMSRSRLTRETMCCGGGKGAIASVSIDPYVNIEKEPKRGPDVSLGLSVVAQGAHMSM